MADTQLVEAKSQWFGKWFSWTQGSEQMLRAAEKRILSYLRTPYRGWFVDIGPAVGTSDKIWTISLNEESENIPLVLLHGLASGVGLWVLNLDSFARTRPVYAMDILGFGRSSRPAFSTDAAQAEQQLVKSVEEWRREMKLDKFILLGHSMGGFLAASYALDYPDHVAHLILADPWGFPERPPPEQRKPHPFWIRALAYAVSSVNPLWAVRTAGPFGQWVIGKVRPDIMKKFSPVVDKAEEVIPQYIYQCNVQSPSGESAFHAMNSGLGWAKNPMVQRFGKLREDVPITCIYGARSWVDHSAVPIIKEQRPKSFFNVRVISGAGHHVYADKHDVFNKFVNEACSIADGKSDSISDDVIDDESDKDNSKEWSQYH